jgi:DNA-binding response OmpR family regulator
MQQPDLRRDGSARQHGRVPRFLQYLLHLVRSLCTAKPFLRQQRIKCGERPLKTDSSIRFGDGFELDLRAYQLRRFDRPLSLEPIPMEILTLLLEQRGHLVTRDQIIQRIWGSEVHVDVSSSINAAVVKIRRVLHDHSGKPRFVETVAGKG